MSTHQFGTWYPIESAPKNGCEILACAGHSRRICYWRETFLDRDGLETSFRGWQPENWSLCSFQATHWMPLPPPPQNEDTGTITEMFPDLYGEG